MKQLIKQNSSIGNLIPNTTKSSVKIYDAYKNMQRIEDFNTNLQMNELVEVLGQWSFYLGLSEKVSDKELILNAQFIKENFGALNIYDLQQAVKMSATEKLGDIQHYGKLSPLFIAKILNSYKSKRSEIIVNINQEVNKLKNSKPKLPPSQEESITNMKIILKSAWETVNNEQQTYLDFGDCVYNFIKKYKLVSVNKILIGQAMEYAEKEIRNEKNKSTIKSVIQNTSFTKLDRESIKRKKAREFMVNKWLGAKSKSYMDNFLKELKYH
jgi:hypothetical protein